MGHRKPCTHVRPSPEDLARITRLEEEILSRAEEMVRILARVDERFPVLPLLSFTQHEGPAPVGASEPFVAFHEFVTTDGHTGCYDNIKNVSCSGPCPC